MTNPIKLVKPISDRGFTILELIIATAIFSGAVLMLILGFLAMSRSYTKGLAVTETQNTARSIINTISQGIQFGSPGTLSIGGITAFNQSGYFCTDNQVFIYSLGEEIINGQDAFVEIPTQNCPLSTSTLPCPENQNLSSCMGKPGAVELLAPEMRLTALTINYNPNNNTYFINVKVVYGNDSYIYPAYVVSTKYYYDKSASNLVHCTGNTAINFCAVANLQTVVGPRIAN